MCSINGYIDFNDLTGTGAETTAAAGRSMAHRGPDASGLHAFGGVLRYGIPSFRLPREVIDHEIETVKSMGVKFVPDVLVGSTQTVQELLKEFDAVYVGSGAGLPTMTGIPGENAVGVRAHILEGLEELGIKIDPELNKIRGSQHRYISTEDSRVKVAVIPTDEELEICRISVDMVEKASK